MAAFRRLEDAGRLELITCGATHGFLPLMQQYPEAVRAQIAVAAASHRRHFGRSPAGIWLPECGYYPGVDELLAEEGIRYFFTDTHGMADATPRPRYGVYAPLFTPSGPAAFARDAESSQQVWSAEHGYPGDPEYREFYRDIGWDLDWEYIKPWIQPDGNRKNVGIKYFRITGKGGAQGALRSLAGPRAGRRPRRQLHVQPGAADRAPGRATWAGTRPIVVSPYDAELYGHWWYEGPQFIDFLVRKVAFDQKVFRLATPGRLPAREPGAAGGHAAALLLGRRRLRRGLAGRVQRLDLPPPPQGGRAHDRAGPRLPGARRRWTRRALNQAARELLLAQSSDWAFIMKTGTMVEYAIRRTREHVLRFTRLHDQIRGRQDRRDLARSGRVAGQHLPGDRLPHLQPGHLTHRRAPRGGSPRTPAR